jgi:glycosyltransferase involved in cell wall biosynthesis
VFETDDDILHADTTLPHLLDADRVATVRECLAMADAVTCSTDVLAGVLREHNPNVHVVPNYIHEDVLAIAPEAHVEPTICWAGGATHLPDLMLIQDPIRGLDARFRFVGVDFSPIFAGMRTEFVPWQVNVWDYYRALSGWVGVIPLTDTPFNASRSPVKALEYAALGIPVVASDVPAYRGFVVDGVTGFLARTAGEWRDRVRLLLADETLRSEMGAKARELAGDWTIQRNWHAWTDVFDRIIGGTDE